MLTRAKIAQSKTVIFTSNTTHVKVEHFSIREALGDKKWKQVMQSEFDALVKSNTCTLVPMVADMNIIGNKWVFITEFNANDNFQKYKARLVAKGFQQTPGLDYFETFNV